MKLYAVCVGGWEVACTICTYACACVLHVHTHMITCMRMCEAARFQPTCKTVFIVLTDFKRTCNQLPNQKK